MISVIVCHGKCVEILPFQNFADIRLVIQDLNLHVLEAVAFFSVRVSRILTVRADILEFQVVCWVSVLF